MRILFLDLASHDGLLACVDDQAIKSSEPVDRRIGDHELIPLFEKTLKEAGWKNEDLTHVACIIGPGGFMSLRVAVAFANTLMRQLGIPGVGIHLSDVYAARVWTSDIGHRTSESFLWLHSTKKHELFIRGFGEYAKLWPEATHITVEDFLKKLSSIPPPTRRSAPPSPGGGGNMERIFWAGELIPEHEALFKDKLIPVPLQTLVDVLPAFLGQQTFTEKLLEPWYGREA